MDNEFYSVSLPVGGFSKTAEAIYILELSGKFYVGKTGTSNKTGRSSPLERLGFHLKKRGNTQSAIEGYFNLSSAKNRSRKDLEGKYHYIFVPDGIRATEIEKALVRKLREFLPDEQILNRIKSSKEPELSKNENRFFEVMWSKAKNLIGANGP